MGRPTPPPPIFGEPCGFCTPQLWGTGQTPRFVMVTFKDIDKCPASPVDVPNGSFVLEQRDVAPCEWRFEGGDYYISWHLMAGGTVLMALWPGGIGKIFFTDTTIVPCELDFVNEQVACGGADVYGSGGTAQITSEWLPNTIVYPLRYEPFLLANDYNFLSVDGTLNDPAEITNDIHCYKFVNLDYATRVLISFDPDLVDS